MSKDQANLICHVMTPLRKKNKVHISAHFCRGCNQTVKTIFL